MRPHVLDSSALFRYLTKGKGAEIVSSILKKANAEGTSVAISAVNWGEVYYTLAKTIGVAKTEDLLADVLQSLPIRIVSAETGNAVRAARLKMQFSIPYVDAFAAEVAGANGVVITSDETHFQRVPKLRLLRLPSHRKS